MRSWNQEVGLGCVISGEDAAVPSYADFPTAGFICGQSAIRAAYHEGRGILTVRARATVVLVQRVLGRDFLGARE